MAVLTTKQRNKLPDSVFKGPGRTFPVIPGDVPHAINAKARATQGVNAGTLSPSAAAKIKAAANKVINAAKKK